MRKTFKKILFIVIIVSIVIFTGCASSTKFNYNDKFGNPINLDTNKVVLIRIPKELKNLSYFPMGTFLAGEKNNGIQKGSAPAIFVSLDPFLMDQKEVSNIEYFAFMDSLKQATTTDTKATRMIKRLIKKHGKIENDIKNFFIKIEKFQFSTNNSDELFAKIDSVKLLSYDKEFNFLDSKQTLQKVIEYIEYKPSVWNNDYIIKDSYHKKDNYPIVGIPWIGAKLYAAFKNKRLPTEMEFEYAMRSGDDHEKIFFFPWLYAGIPIIKDQNSKILAQNDYKNYYFANYIYSFGIAAKDSFNYTAPVNSFPQGTKGLYSIAGNVGEFCEDDYEYNSFQKKNIIEEVINPLNISINRSHSNLKVIKGGSWKDYIYKLRSNYRDAILGNKRYSNIGFRCVMDIDIFMNKVITEINNKKKKHFGEENIVILTPRNKGYTKIIKDIINKYIYDEQKKLKQKKDDGNKIEKENTKEFEETKIEEDAQKTLNNNVKIRE